MPGCRPIRLARAAALRVALAAGLDHAPAALRALIAHSGLALLLTLALPLPGHAAPGSCTRDDFATAVDRAGAQLRAFNSAEGPKISAAMKALQTKRGWSDAELEAKALTLLHDRRTAALDERANDLLQQIDTLGEVDAARAPDCNRLPDLEKAGRDLLAVMQEKAQLTRARIDAAMAGEEATAAASLPPATSGAASPTAAAAASRPTPPAGAAATAPRREAAPAPAAAAARDAAPTAAKAPGRHQQTGPAGSWDARTTRAPAPADGSRMADAQMPGSPGAPPSAEIGDAYSPPPPGALLGGEGDNAFTIDEVREATRGFFGTISTSLASVIEYAFSNYGRPTAYVLGTEGGGAFLAGARYGKGRLFMRKGEERTVYWHGPSIGYDFGAEGSRTLFLIYRMGAPEDLFRRFGGVDGSAYVLGGVGLTLLKGGPVLMAPIRTGVGLRLGANVGYVRFTPQATWNPF